mmetsp:Transcript_45475/g.142560  ORF Transcript_45475/g.142560 Transcript_45475/m.142560 type:complete len:603 (+) Transcript_45475:178-1986(+)
MRSFRTEVLPVVARDSGMTVASAMLPDNDSGEGRRVIWQWEHRTGYKNYDARASAKIERAFQSGDSMVRLRSGKGGSIPMEVFFHDMLQHDPVSGNTRKVRRLGPTGIWQRTRRWIAEVARSLETGRPRKVMFSQYQEHRHNLYRELDAGVGLHFHSDVEHKEWLPRLVASQEFFVISMGMVLLNLVWIVIDAEWNEAPHIWEADTAFQVAEYSFCVFFTAELAIRFFALERKRRCWKDRWFLLDTLLVVAQVIESLVMPFILANRRVDSFGYLRVARLLRLARLGRVVRMLHLFPEMTMLLRGITRALKSVFTTLLMLVVLLGVFAIIFKTQSNDDEDLRQLFPSLPDSVWVLLLRGTFLDSPSVPFYAIYEKSVSLAMAFVVFIFLSSFTVLNMLIGILCDVVCQVSQMEKDDNAASFLRTTLLDLLECYDRNEDRHLARREFELLMVNPEMRQILQRFDVDAGGLLSQKDMLFEPVEREVVKEDEDGEQVMEKVMEERTLTFGEFLEVVLRLRGQNSATVMDIVDLREYVRKRLDRLETGVNPRATSRATSATRASAMLPGTFPSDPGPLKTMSERSELAELRDEVRELRQTMRRLFPP